MPSTELTPDQVADAQKVMDRLTGDRKGTKKVHSLPLVSTLFRGSEDMNRAIDLLNQGHDTRDQLKTLETAQGKNKEDVIAICAGCEVEGFRMGARAVSVGQQKRSSLKQDKLIAELLARGVQADVIGDAIKAATVEGEPFYVVKFEDVP